MAQLAAVGAGAAIIKFGADAVGAASDLTESLNKVNVVFEDSADTIVHWSEDSATSMGISQQAALESAGTFGNLFDAMGIVDSAGAEMSMTLVQLASDLASFNNQDPTDVLQALQSGLTGQIRPLRQFGIEISEAALKQEALAQGITKSTTEMTLAEKVQLRYALILKQTGNAQGDFARTSDDLENKSRILRAQWQDLQADLGKLLIPAVLALVGAFSDLVTVLQFVASGFKDFNSQVKEAGINVGVAELKVAAWAEEHAKSIPIIGSVVDVIEQVRDANEASNAAWDALPPVVDTVSAAIHAAVDRFRQARQAMDDSEEATRELTDAMRENRLATLALTNSFFGIQDSADQVEAAQRKLNQMQKAGKTDTEAYDQAVTDAILAQAGLEEAVISYAQELVDSGQKQKDVTDKIRALGREFGLTKSDLDPLIDRIRAYINELNRVPSTVNTTVTTHFVKSGSGTFQTGGSLQHGGVVERTGMALVHKGEVFSGTHNEMGFGNSVTVNVTGWVGNDQQIAKRVRDELVKLGKRNVTSGI